MSKLRPDARPAHHGEGTLEHASPNDFTELLDEPDRIADNMRAYIAGISPEARDVLDRFDFPTQITRLHKSNADGVTLKTHQIRSAEQTAMP